MNKISASLNVKKHIIYHRVEKNHHHIMRFFSIINFTISYMVIGITSSIILLILIKKKLDSAFSKIKSRFVLIRFLQTYFGLQPSLFVCSTLLLEYLVISITSMTKISNNLEYKCTPLCQLIAKISNAQVKYINFNQQINIEPDTFYVVILCTKILSILSFILYIRLIIQPQGELVNTTIKNLGKQSNNDSKQEQHAYLNEDDQELAPQDKILLQQQKKHANLQSKNINMFIPGIKDIQQLRKEHLAVLKYITDNCMICNNANTINCKHNELDDQCYQYFDHTCPWTGRHITGANMRRFIHYLACVAAVTSLSMYFCLKILVIEMKFLKEEVFNGQKIGVFYAVPMLLLRSDDSQVLLLFYLCLTIIVSIPVTMQVIGQLIQLTNNFTYYDITKLYNMQKKMKKGSIKIVKIVDYDNQQDDTHQAEYIVLSQKSHIVLDDQGNAVKISKIQEGSIYQLSESKKVHIQPLSKAEERKIMRSFPYKCSPIKKWTWYKRLERFYSTFVV